MFNENIRYKKRIVKENFAGEIFTIIHKTPEYDKLEKQKVKSEIEQKLFNVFKNYF